VHRLCNTRVPTFSVCKPQMLGMSPDEDLEALEKNRGMSHLSSGEYAQRPLRIASRPPMSPLQICCSGLFYGQLLVQLAAFISVLMTQNTYKLSDGVCSAGYVKDIDKPLCIQLELKAQLDSSAPPADALVDSEGEPVDRRLKEQGRMQKGNGWFMVLWASCGAIPLICLVWLIILAKFATVALWGTIVANVIIMCCMFCFTFNWMLLVVAAVLIVLAYFAREKIEIARRSLPHPGLLRCVIAIWAIGLFALNSQAVGPDCELQSSWVASFWLSVCPVLSIFTTMFFRCCIVSVLAMSIGFWYFPEETADVKDEVSGSPALYGGKLALTTSSGDVFVASLIMGCVELAKQDASKPWWWLDPTAWLLKAVICCFEATISNLTRFALISSLFQGDNIFHAGLTIKELLVRRLPTAFATGFLANIILNQIAAGLATGVGFLVWFLFDLAEDIGHFENAPKTVALLTCSMFLSVRWKPTATLILSLVCSSKFNDSDMQVPKGTFESFFTAQAIAAVASIIFSYMACVLEYATDIVFYCVVVESEYGRVDARTVKLHDLVQKQLENEQKQLENE